MELPKYTRLIESELDNVHAIPNLMEFYRATAEEEKEKFVAVLIGQLVVKHQLLNAR